MQLHSAAQNLFYTWFVIIASNIFIIRSNEIRLYQRLNRVSTWFTIIGFIIIIKLDDASIWVQRNLFPSKFMADSH